MSPDIAQRCHILASNTKIEQDDSKMQTFFNFFFNSNEKDNKAVTLGNPSKLSGVQ